MSKGRTHRRDRVRYSGMEREKPYEKMTDAEVAARLAWASDRSDATRQTTLKEPSDD